jgi:hypothetical protein
MNGLSYPYFQACFAPSDGDVSDVLLIFSAG